MQNTSQNLEATYISYSGEMYKGYISLSKELLIFNNSKKIITRIHKDEISSFKINNLFLNKNISLRINGKNHKFKLRNKSVELIVNFIKS